MQLADAEICFYLILCSRHLELLSACGISVCSPKKHFTIYLAKLAKLLHHYEMILIDVITQICYPLCSSNFNMCDHGRNPSEGIVNCMGKVFKVDAAEN